MGVVRHTFLVLVASLTLLPTILALSYGFPYGSEKVRGVNLGGWLVLEVSYNAASNGVSTLFTSRLSAVDHALAIRQHRGLAHR